MHRFTFVKPHPPLQGFQTGTNRFDSTSPNENCHKQFHGCWIILFSLCIFNRDDSKINHTYFELLKNQQTLEICTYGHWTAGNYVKLVTNDVVYVCLRGYHSSMSRSYFLVFVKLSVKYRGLFLKDSLCSLRLGYTNLNVLCSSTYFLLPS